MPELLSSFVEEHGIDPANETDFLALILGLSTLSSYLKNTVQALLEAHGAAKIREEKERREDAKRQKEEKKAAAKIAKLEAAMQEARNESAKSAREEPQS